MSTALITGISGQDGSYLAEFLLERGYHVHGLVRRSSSVGTPRLDHIYQDPHETDRHLELHYGDLTDSASLINLVERTEPDEIYNLAAQSHVKVSFELPEFTTDVTAVGPASGARGHEGREVEGALLPGFVVGDVRLHAPTA